MIEAQKKLLADLQAAEASAVALYRRGVKIASTIQPLRAARQELEARVRFLEKHTPEKAAPKPKPTKPAA